MIAISSFRPLEECTPAIVRNQIVAHQSWESVFDKIIYLGEPEEKLFSPKTTFYPAEDFPRIKEMAHVAALQRNMACLINADIFVRPKMKSASETLINIGAVAAISKRYEFDYAYETNLDDSQVTDCGLDFFAAYPKVWAKVFAEIPSEFRIGHILFDTWLLAFFLQHWPDQCYDITPAKVIFHPKHGDRRDQSMSGDVGKELRNKVRWPKHALNVPDVA